MGAKSPEVVETSGLFALISFLVQLDGKQHPFRSLDLKSPEISSVNRDKEVFTTTYH